VNALLESLKTLIKQSTEALGAEAPSTLMLKQQLADALAEQEKSRKVLWIRPVEPPKAGPDEKKG
jgi:hypothetical protein